MRIITRYILRAHIGPLLFCLSALTTLLLLQYVARQLDKIVGKGLPWAVIGKFLLFSLPFTIAMTLPMAVLMATLHAFGGLAAEHEITAFRASGVRVRTLMAPVLFAAAALSLLMVGFNDQVLPRANHQLSILLGDIINVRPTAALREQVLTKLGDTFYMKVGWLDETSNRMRQVEIHDIQNSASRKSVYADSGTFTLSKDSSDLQLVLYNGESLEFPEGNARKLQRTFFREQVLRVEGVARGFNASASEGGFKSEREQSICELQQEYKLRAHDYELRRQRWIEQLRAEAASSDSVLRVPRPRPAHGGLAKLYCETIPGWFTPKTAEAAEVAAVAIIWLPQDSTRQDSIRRDSLRRDSLRQDSTRRDSVRQDSMRRAAPPAAILPTPPQGALPLPTVGPDGLPLTRVGPDGLPLPTAGPGGLPLPTVGPDGLPVSPGGLNPELPDDGLSGTTPGDASPPMRTDAEGNPLRPAPSMFAVTTESLNEALMSMHKYSVEVQKKFALSMACIVFVLFGPPIALRFPRGGVGVTLGVSLIVFAAYYVCLMAGETLADRGTLNPVVAMWAANVIFTVAGLILFLRMERTDDASRGGGLLERWQDWRVRRTLRREVRLVAAPDTAT